MSMFYTHIYTHAHMRVMQCNFTGPMNNPANEPSCLLFHDLLNGDDLFLHSASTIHSLQPTTSSPLILPLTTQSFSAQSFG